VARGEERPYLVGQAVSISRNQELQISGDALNELVLLNKMGQPNQNEGKQRDDGQKRIIGDGSGQQQTLFALEISNNLKEKNAHAPW
jgi:hypothetical protein